MPKNTYYIKNEVQKPVENYELKKDEYQIPSFEEFMKSYEMPVNYADLEHSDIGDSKGYEPCKNSLCGCSCYSHNCTCASASVKVGKWGSSAGAYGRTWEEDIEPDDKMIEAVRKMYLPQREVGGQASGSMFGFKDNTGELKVLSATAAGEINSKNIKGKLSADLYNVKTDGIQIRAGVSVDTGLSIENGFEAKLAGFGFSVGKQTGISTPVGEIKVDTENCVIQCWYWELRYSIMTTAEIVIIVFATLAILGLVLFYYFLHRYKVVKVRCWICKRRLETSIKNVIKFESNPNPWTKKVPWRKPVCRKCRITRKDGEPISMGFL